MDDGKKGEGIPQRKNDRPYQKDLYVHVVPSVATKWKALGEILLHYDIVETGYLKIIETNNPKDVVECCRQMFIKWLETDKDASWDQLITALQSPGVQLNFLAEEIKKKLQKDKTPQAPVITNHPQDVLIGSGFRVLLQVKACGAMPLYYQWYYEHDIVHGENEPFYSIFPVTIRNAGCYYCQVKNHYGITNSNNATVTVTSLPKARPPSSSEFTYFPLAAGKSTTLLSNKVLQIQNTGTSADSEDEVDKMASRKRKQDQTEHDAPASKKSAESKLPEESTEYKSVDATFSSFVDDMFDILEQQNFDKIKRKPLENLNVVGGISVTEDIEDKIDQSENLSDLFKTLSRRCRPYWNWMNIRMLEKLAGNSLAAEKTIKKYKKNIYSRKVKDVMSDIYKLEIPTNGYTEVNEKWKKNFDDLIIEDIVQQWEGIEKKFNVEGTMLLKSIKEGCVEVCWLLPNDLVEQVICSVTNNQQSRHDDDDDQSGTGQDLFPEVLYLKIGDYVIKDDINDEYLSIAANILAHHKETVLEYYTPLTMFCYKENYTKSEATAVARMLTSTGTMTNRHHSNVHGKITENISDIFAPFEKFTSFPDKILIEGAAGSGKTTLCKEIALQWANKNILKNKKMLFLLFMCDPQIKNLTTVELLVKHFYQSEILANKITDWLKTTNGKYLTIIIDGYSEGCASSFISDGIVGRKILMQCNLVITSRSPASSHLSKIINQKVLVLGFTKSNQINFIDNVQKRLDLKVNYLKNHLNSNPIINKLCHNPLMMNLLLQSVEEGMGSLPKIRISLIQKYFITITTKKIVSSLTDLPHPYQQAFKELSKFAFIAVQEDQLAFTVDEVLELCENRFQDKSGFLNKILELGLINTVPFETQHTHCEIVHFNHVIVQEYLAAYYISSLPDNELLKLLNGTFWTIRYFNVWIMYVGITGGKCSAFKSFLSNSQPFGALIINPSNKINYCFYQLRCLIEADGELDNTLLGKNIDLNDQKLLRNHLHTLAILLTKSTNKQWNNLNLSGCGIDSQGCTILYEMLCSSTELQLKTVDFSYNNFHWESFYIICSMLKAWNTTKFVFSIDTLYDAIIMNKINNFIAMLEENFQNDESSNSVLLLTYVAKQSALTAVYSAPTCIRWAHYIECKLNEDAIKHVRTFIENKVGDNKYKLAFSYSIIDYYENLLTLLSCIENIQLCGSYLHSKGAYLLNIASTIDYQYHSPQELVADYLAAVLCHSLQSTTLYLESLPAAYVTMVKNSLKHDLSMSVFDISNNSISNQIMTEITGILPFMSNLQKFYASNNNLLGEGAIVIAKSLQNFSTLTVFNISNNSICEKAADDIAVVLSYSTQLQELYLNNNNFKTAGMIKIARALQNTFTLTVFNIDNNKVGEEAADDIAVVLSHSTQLQELHLNNNNLKTAGMITIAKALQNISTLTVFNIDNNTVGEEAANDIARVLSKNATLQILILDNNSFGTAGIIEIAKALQSISTLTLFSIDNNNVGVDKIVIVEEAANEIATVLSHNTKLQQLVLSNNWFKVLSMIIIAQALPSSITFFSIANNDVDEGAADHVAKAFSQNTKLEQLNLNDNKFRTGGMKTIAKGLQHISTLTTLNISSNIVGKEAADDIAKVLSHNNNLQELYLDNNHFETSSMNKFAEALQNTSTLTVLSFSYNFIGDGAADNIAKIVSHNSQLQKLCLSKNLFKTEGMIKIARVLQTITTLTVLNISKNNVGEAVADDIAAVLKCNTNLKELDLHDNNLKTSGIIEIAKALLNTSTLTVFNISNNNVTKEAADYVCAVLSHNTQLQELYLDNNSFNTIGIIKIANVLQTSSTLRVFSISNNNVGEEATDDIAAVLLHNTQLQQLYLDNNNLMTRGMIKIAKCMQNTFTLTVFDVGNNNIGKEAADTIATVLSHNTQLKLLNVNNSSFMIEGIIKITQALTNTSNLTTFSVINNGVDDKAAGYIATALSHNTKLQRLDFGYNSFKSAGMIKIANALQDISNLTTIAINNNGIDDEAANAIAAVLSHNRKLQELDFGYNSFKSPGMIRITQAMKRIRTLTIFAINNNGVDETAADELAKVLFRNSQLQGLDLSNNNFKSAGMIIIAKELQTISTLVVFSISNNDVDEEAADDIAAVLSHNRNLQKLYLNTNNFKSAGMIKIAKALQTISTLIVFNISNNNIGKEAADDIATVLSHNRNLQKLSLYTNNFKTEGMIKIAKALQTISTLIVFNISNNNIGKEAADDIATVLSHSTNLQKLYLDNNKFKTEGMIKIAKSLQNISTLQILNISNNNVGKDAADNIAAVLSHNIQLQQVYLQNNDLRMAGAIKITEALRNTFTLAIYNISGNNIKKTAKQDFKNILSWNTKLKFTIY